MGYFGDDAQQIRVRAMLGHVPNLSRSLFRTRLFMYLAPSVIAIVGVTGWVGYSISDYYIHVGVERMTKVLNLAMGNALEQHLELCRQDLLNIARHEPTAENLRIFLEDRAAIRGAAYAELGYIPLEDQAVVVYVADGQAISAVPPGRVAEIRGSPLLLFNEIRNLAPGTVHMTAMREVEYPFFTSDKPYRRLSLHTFRMITPYVDASGQVVGHVFLGIDARELRNVLSLYNSPQSPIAAFPRSPTMRVAYFFDADGWIGFQSEDYARLDEPLSTQLARSGYSGSLGRPENLGAFRPFATHLPFWKMVGDVADGQSGMITLKGNDLPPEATGEYFLAYAPVHFSSVANATPQIVGGVAYLDRSRLPLLAGYEHVDTLLVVMVASMAFVLVIIYVVGTQASRPLYALADAVRAMRFQDRLLPLSLEVHGYETRILRDAVNHLVGIVNAQIEELCAKDRAIETAGMKEEVSMHKVAPDLEQALDDSMVPGIVGRGLRIEALRSEILKAARANVDVLIIGETGTGKQLAAEAVHRLSDRCTGPFISINCGALDENLLLDTLFGHTKGAFTGAKTDRKGAFLEAHGGVLFLDEIQAASQKVQQSLLRAISIRIIKPLGSDKEIPVDVRLIAATNIDLKEAIERNEFREDLYFRLNVITIHTPALRDNPEDIPALAFYYLHKAEKLVTKERVAFSKGALEKLKQYDWPGNVRELKNVVTRAVVMSEGPVIFAEDVLLDAEAKSVDASPALAEAHEGRGEDAAAVGSGLRTASETRLNARQQRVWPSIRERGEVTRAEYEQLVGGDIPSRTAAYDLQDLVRKGLLIKAGRGPATKYLVAAHKISWHAGETV
ncbi:putative Sigma 54 interacting domain protein [Megalodesulfovibrio gigas DSM 1382 = ATCC 19364]|uniref:Putative Sigma 54 interacting domain protein n=2 Tax=Megalodesulfovibrio gigas TaxID=879 RepID=T2GEN5_MEGG1|nr:putative Sigma 54 interacting domain protein [Megalodesulfovibrio gigas DSM 1382 = ATCC 19364]